MRVHEMFVPAWSSGWTQSETSFRSSVTQMDEENHDISAAEHANNTFLLLFVVIPICSLIILFSFALLLYCMHGMLCFDNRTHIRIKVHRPSTPSLHSRETRYSQPLGETHGQHYLTADLCNSPKPFPV